MKLIKSMRILVLEILSLLKSTMIVRVPWNSIEFSCYHKNERETIKKYGIPSHVSQEIKYFWQFITNLLLHFRLNNIEGKMYIFLWLWIIYGFPCSDLKLTFSCFTRQIFPNYNSCHNLFVPSKKLYLFRLFFISIHIL
jgi:hypothetical protein